MFIVIEGPEGAGKTLAMEYLKEITEAMNLPAVFTKEPGDGLPEAREVLKNREVEPSTEAALVAADRFEHVTDMIDHMSDGYIVFCDRYVQSTWAFQIQGRDLPHLKELGDPETYGLFPDISLYIMASKESRKDRVEQRGFSDPLEDDEELQSVVDRSYQYLIGSEIDHSDLGERRVIMNNGDTHELYEKLETFCQRLINNG